MGAAKRQAARALRAVHLEQAVRARVVGPLRAARSARDDQRYEEQVWAQVKHHVRTAASGDGPIVVGPWVSEVGYEVLYWVPFLRWLVDRFEIDPSRVHVVSRGGVGSWYADVGAHYLDIFDTLTPEEFREYTEARWNDLGGQKQMEYSKWDQRILKQVVGDLRWSRHAVLSPSLMYRLFHHFIRGTAPITHALNHLAFRPFPQPDGGEWEQRLPDEPFIAVKFYFRPSFPGGKANREIVREIVASLAEQIPVVLLNTGMQIDDHDDIDPGVSGRVTYLLDDVPPNRNLHVQSLAIARSAGFVGTYGGLAYLGPAYGKPTIALFSHGEHFLPSHLDLCRRATIHTGGSIVAMDAARLNLLGSLADALGEHA